MGILLVRLTRHMWGSLSLVQIRSRTHGSYQTHTFVHCLIQLDLVCHAWLDRLWASKWLQLLMMLDCHLQRMELIIDSNHVIFAILLEQVHRYLFPRMGWNLMKNIGSLVCSLFWLLQTSHRAMQFSMSLIKPGEYSISLALRKQPWIPMWLLWILAFISSLTHSGTNQPFTFENQSILECNVFSNRECYLWFFQKEIIILWLTFSCYLVKYQMAVGSNGDGLMGYRRLWKSCCQCPTRYAKTHSWLLPH